MRAGFLDLKTMSAHPVVVGPVTVTPIARSITLSGRHGATTVAWPSSVRVSRDGRTSRIPVVNATRCAQAAVLVAAVATYFVLTRFGPRKERLS